MSRQWTWSNLAPIAPVAVLIVLFVGCPQAENASQSDVSSSKSIAEGTAAAINYVSAPDFGESGRTTAARLNQADAVSRDAESIRAVDRLEKGGEEAPIVDTQVAQVSGKSIATENAKSGGSSVPRADAKNEDGTYGESHVDPVKQNGPIFVDWPRPKLALLLSGAQQGYIEPCGCAGLENQKGGLSRRHQLINKLRADGWPLAAFDAGGLVKKFGRQQELKYAASVEGLKAMEYDAIAFGGDDLRLSTDELIAAVTPVDEKPSSFVATNVALLTFEDKLVPRMQIVEEAGLRIGVLGVIGAEEQRKIRNDDVQMKPAAVAIAEMLPALQKPKCDKLVLLSNSTLKEAEDLATRFPQFDFVVTTGGADEPPAQLRKVGQRTHLIEVGHKGMYCVVIGIYDDRDHPLRYQRVPLDARFGESEAMTQVLVAYQEQLKELGFEGLGLVPRTGLPRHPKGQKFVGSQVCGECHTTAFDIWKDTPHAHGTETLLKLAPQRHFDPECLSCHVTGWDPQKYFPFASGFLDVKQQSLHGNGCENCHGPGEKHVAAERMKETNIEQRDKLRLAMRLTQTDARKQTCLACHDIDNSPDYNWDEYWPQVEHQGKD
jgi:hypothetical protein